MFQSAGVIRTLSLIAIVACVAVSSSAVDAAEARSSELTRWIDEQMQVHWDNASLKVPQCDDGTFLRRVYLDLVGRIPSVSETRDFVNETSHSKRAHVVDYLLGSAGSDDEGVAGMVPAHLARVWRRMMIPPGSNGVAMGPRFEPWLRQQFRDNTGYDEIARRLITAQGNESLGATLFYQAVGGTPDAYAASVSRIFLGVRIECARCHDHPFADWKQRDFWGMAAFFNGMQLNPREGNGVPGEGLVQNNRSATISFEGKSFRARVLWSDNEKTTIPQGRQPRDVLADWLTRADNPNFSAAAVNRVWQHLLGRGLVPEVDDLDLATRAQRELLLDGLAAKFAEAQFDLRWLIAGICKSRVYQCPSVADARQEPSPLTGKRPLKALTPEQTFDSLEQALLLSVTRSDETSARHNGLMNQIVNRLDESSGEAPDDYVAGVPQVLMLMNGRMIAEATDLKTSRTLRAVVDAPFLNQKQKIETLYLAAMTRLPTSNEQTVIARHLAEQTTEEARRAAYGEVFWALLNSPEFVLCR